MVNSVDEMPVNEKTGEIEKRPERPVVKVEKNKPIGSINNLSGLMKNPAVKALISKGMSSVINFEHLAKMAIVATQRMPKLLQCTQESFLFALTTAGQLGVDPSGATGQAYIIPYGNVATFQIAYKGLIALVCRSGMSKSVSVHIVWKDEAESMQWDKESAMRHIPNWEAKRDYTIKGKDNIAFLYGVASHGDGVYTFDYMTADEIENIRKKHSKSKSGPWFDSYTEMAKKTMLIRLAKKLPMSTEPTSHEMNAQLHSAITSSQQEPEEAEYEEITLEMPVTERSPGAAEEQGSLV